MKFLRRISIRSSPVSAAAERQLGDAGEITAVGIKEEGFAALAAPFDRTAKPARGPYHEDVFAIEQVLGAEPAADVAADHPHLALVDTENPAQGALLDQ